MTDAFLPAWCTLPLLFVAGLASLWWCAQRLTSSATLLRIVLLSYALHAAVALVLAAIAYWQLPILSSLYTPDGFWAFAPDASTYHVFASKYVARWHYGLELIHPWIAVEYIIFVAAIYALFGVNMLFPILVNCWLTACCGVLGFRIAEHLFDHKAGVMSAALICFWPSTFIWSSQLLKDPLCLLLMLLVFVLLMQIFAGVHTPRARTRWWHWVGLACLVIVMTRFRFYLGIVVACTVFLVSGVAALRALTRADYRRSLTYLGLILLVLVSARAGQMINSLRAASPRHPASAHHQLAVTYWQQGQPQQAAYHQLRAIEINGRFQQNLLEMVNRPATEEDMYAAANMYEAFLEYKQQAGEATFAVTGIVHRILAQLYTQLGDAAQAASRFAEARVVYQQAQKHRRDIAVTHTKATTGVDLQRLEWVPEDVRTTPALINIGLEYIGMLRKGSIHDGGNAQIDAEADISTPERLLRYLPRAFCIALFAPFPWQWFDTTGSTGAMRLMAGGEMLLFYLLLPSILMGIGRMVRAQTVEGWLLLTYITLLIIALSLVVANVGILFRLRLQFLIPMLMLSAGGGAWRVYPALWHRGCRRIR